VAAGVGGVLSVLAALITLEGSDSRYDWLAALARAFMVATPIAVGLYTPATGRRRAVSADSCSSRACSCS
jgi:hypothetical protein